MTTDAMAQLLACVTAICYAAALVSSRLGLRYSTPDTVTLVSILVQNVTLWSAVYWTGGMPIVSGVAVGIFCIVGLFQMGVRLFAYTGVLKIGASRSSSLQSISPLFSATLAITILGEPATPLILAGTLLVEGGTGAAELSLVAFITARWRRLSHGHESSAAPLRLQSVQRAAIFFRVHGRGVPDRLSPLSDGLAAQATA
jgi:drug/metabolite transporter (DMT)-like permease